MKQKDYTGIIPQQHTGEEIEAEVSLELKDDQATKIFYETVKERLLNVNNWHAIAGMISARFQLVDEGGRELTGHVKRGCYLRVDIPGPGSREGDGYDWVFVEELKEVCEENVESIGFRVRPAQNPLGEKNETAHFYSNSSTSNFIVTREGKKISSWIIDRNTAPNVNGGSLTDKIRNTTVGMGAVKIFSKIQWHNLAKGLIKQESK